ncbi:MAG TPA: hypothetical protein VNX26_16285 [Candidatus Acidoferrum sp.]|jgi:hypothetical protein|nr:hypothetical protein [Candidatus Acidoferrum sp.]
MDVARESDEFLVNRAYRCFAFLGLITLPLGLAALLQVFGLMNFDMGTIGKDSGGVGQTLSGVALLVGMLLGLPVVAGMLYVTIYGIRQTVRFRHPPLVALSLISIVCGGGLLIVMANEWDVDHGGSALTRAMDIAGGLYVGANVLIPAWWFIKGRRHYRSKAVPRE